MTMSLFLMTLLAIVIGGLLILGALYLLYVKKITLDQVVKNPSLKAAAMKVEISNILKVGTNVPALGLFLVGLVLIASGLYYANEEAKRKVEDVSTRLARASGELAKARTELDHLRTRLNVTGAISKEDARSPSDVEVRSRWPAFYPDGEGKLNGFTVQRDADGRLPILAFSHPNYEVATLDLNEEKVEGFEITVPAGKVKLKKLAGKGGAP
jgi:hypothetical protein